MAQEITVTGWTLYDDGRPENPLGGIGGWVDGHSFDEYLADLVDEAKPYAIALRDAVVREQRRTCGDEHQRNSDGAPVFSDGTMSTFTFRAWGDLMAAIWNTAENTSRYSYMSFYMAPAPAQEEGR